MRFNIIAPIVTTIDGDSLKEAIKNFIKFNHRLNITNMIIKDQQNHINANIEYYKQDGRNKVGIDMYPISYPFVNNYVQTPTMMSPNVYPNAPFIPTVIKIPIKP